MTRHRIMADYTRLSAGRSGFDSPCRGHIMSLEIWNHIKLEIDKARPPIVLMEDKDGTD